MASNKSVLRRFGTEITNTSSSSILHSDAIKKSTGALKNKFNDRKSSRCEDWKKKEEAKDQPKCKDMAEEELALQKEKRAERRKTILKKLEVCDLLDLRKPLCAAEYATEIYKHWKEEEENFLIYPDFLDGSEIEERHRRRLVEWLSEVHSKFKLLPETFFITCKIIDMSIQKFGVQKSNLQLLSLGALLISTKYEEIYPPSVK